jgi:vancomycin resistance protein VanJ
MPLTAVSSIALLPVALSRREWMASAAMCVGLVAILSRYSGQLVWRGDSAKTAALRVEVCNVGDGLASPGLLVQAISESGADIVGLVEVAESQRRVLRAELGESYPYQVYVGGGTSGKAILSRYAITGWQVLALNPSRPDLAARVQVTDRQVRVIVAHPPPPRIQTTGVHFTDAAEAQFASLLRIAADGENTVLVGDLNITPQHQLYDRLRSAGLVDSFEEAGTGSGFTFARRIGPLTLPPVLRIDYVWHSFELRAVEARVGPDVGSDHLPVVADLAWADGQDSSPN